MNIEDKHYETECSAVETPSVNLDSRVVTELCRLLKKMQYIGFHVSFLSRLINHHQIFILDLLSQFHKP